MAPLSHKQFSQFSMEKYEKISLIGRGASGTVYLYKTKSNGKLVILKQIPVDQMSKEERLSSLNEGRVLSILQHPNIIEYHESFLQDEAITIVMEYARGGTLHDFIKQRNGKSLDEKEILNFTAQILLSLQHIHSHQILHRDLKSENILLDKSRKILKIGDFGISKLLTSKSKASTVVGTPSYISPELCEGKAYNQKSDIWALGCIIYELITLKKAFEATTLPALILKILSANFAPIHSNNYSNDLKELVNSLLHLDPNRRPNIAEIMTRPILINAIADFYTDYGLIELNQRVKTEENNSNEDFSHLFLFGGRMKFTQIGICSNKITSISLGKLKLGVTECGRVVRWTESTENSGIFVPRFIEGLNSIKIVRVVSKDSFTIYLSDRGILLSSGNSRNCLGHGDQSDIKHPKIIESLLGYEITSVNCGPKHVIAITNSKVFGWGCNDDGRLGLGSSDSFAKPQRIRFSRKIKFDQIYCGRNNSVLIDKFGKMWVCGSNKHDKLWLGEIKNQKTFKKLENPPWNDESVARVALGRNHSAVVTTNGNLFTADMESMDLLSKLTIKQVGCGDRFTAISCDDGRIFSWGKNGLKTYNETKLAVKYAFNVKELQCWSTNTMILIEKKNVNN